MVYGTGSRSLGASGIQLLEFSTQNTFWAIMFSAFSLQKDNKGDIVCCTFKTVHKFHFVKCPTLDMFRPSDLLCHMVFPCRPSAGN